MSRYLSTLIRWLNIFTMKSVSERKSILIVALFHSMYISITLGAMKLLSWSPVDDDDDMPEGAYCFGAEVVCLMFKE